MNYISILLIGLITQFSFSQNTETYQTVLKSFQENFNTQNIDSVFNLYTTEMQEGMTKEGVTRFVNGCYEQFGKLNKISFIETAEGVNSYTATFDKMDLLMEVQINNQGKITSIQFQEP